MDLSDGEKLIILMLCELNKPKNQRELDSNLISEAINSGETWVIPYVYSGLDFKSPHPSSVSTVVEYLSMWEDLEKSFKKLNKADQSAVTKFTTFDGFDGNHESDSHSIAIWLIKKLKLWPHFKNHSLNSHSARKSIYAKMLQKYQQIKKSQNYKAHHLSASDLQNIF